MNFSFITYLQENQYSKKSIESTIYVVDTYLKWLSKQGIEEAETSKKDVLAYMQHLRNKNLKSITISDYVLRIKVYYNFLQQEQLIANNPTTGIKIQGTKRKQLYSILEPHILHELYNQYPSETAAQQRNKVIIGLLVYQGIRTTELRELEIQDIKIREGKVQVPGTKKSETRELKLQSHQILEVYDWLLQVKKGEKEEKLFNNLNIKNTLYKIMSQLRKQNSKVKNAQQLRASIIVKWLKQYNLRKVQVMAGHKYVSSTENYLQNDIESLQEKIEQYHPF